MRMKINLWEMQVGLVPTIAHSAATDHNSRPNPPSQRNLVCLIDICEYQYQQVHIDDQPAALSRTNQSANINITYSF